jgi:hypothetical protein
MPTIPAGMQIRITGGGKKMGFRTLLLGLAVLCLTVLPAAVFCADDKENGGPITVIGTITYIDFEGGFYGFVSGNGDRYFPINLDQQYKVNNTKVRIKGKIRENVMTTIMWGTPLEILKIQGLCQGESL